MSIFKIKEASNLRILITDIALMVIAVDNYLRNFLNEGLSFSGPNFGKMRNQFSIMIQKELFDGIMRRTSMKKTLMNFLQAF